MSAWALLANSATQVAHSRFARNWSLLVTSNLLVQTLEQPLPTTFGAALASILVLGIGVTWGLARPMLH